MCASSKAANSTGVRGIKLANYGKEGGDEVVSLCLLHHSDATTAEARAYLKQASAARRALAGEEEASVDEIRRNRGSRRRGDADAKSVTPSSAPASSSS